QNSKDSFVTDDCTSSCSAPALILADSIRMARPPKGCRAPRQFHGAVREAVGIFLKNLNEMGVGLRKQAAPTK
ncbi:hypothetical protein, partial [Methylogaea oryzae]|uniref:hypothetical protein n=1 Tax=Methylogaea oryzae TaxID=1295382 RepID=UPI001C3F4DC0